MNNIVKIEMSVGLDDIVHSQIQCDKETGFQRTLESIKLFIKELESQIKNKNKCPFSKK